MKNQWKPERFPAQPPVQAGQPKKITPAIAQPRISPSLHVKHPVAPAVYRPQPTPNVLQRKTVGNQPRTQSGSKPVAPPIYRPQAVPKCLQAKMPDPAVKSSRPAPVAPPVYRPQPLPKALQLRKPLEQQPKGLVQPKASMQPRNPSAVLQASLSVQKKLMRPQSAAAAQPPAVSRKTPLDRPASKPLQPKYGPQAQAAIQTRMNAHGGLRGGASNPHQTHRPLLSRPGRSTVLQLATTAEMITATLNTDEIAEEAGSLGITADNYRTMLIEVDTQELTESFSAEQGFVGVGWFERPLDTASCYRQSSRLLDLLRTNNDQLASASARGSEGRDALVLVVNALTAHIRQQNVANQPTIYRVACGEHGFALIVRDGRVEQLESFANERTLRTSATANRRYTVDNVCTSLTNLVAANIRTRGAAAASMGWNADGIGLGAGFPENLGDKGFNWECSLMGNEEDIQERIEERITANRQLVTRRYRTARASLGRRRAQEERALEMALAALRARGRGNARGGGRRNPRRGEVVRAPVPVRGRARGRGGRGAVRGRGVVRR